MSFAILEGCAQCTGKDSSQPMWCVDIKEAPKSEQHEIECFVKHTSTPDPNVPHSVAGPATLASLLRIAAALRSGARTILGGLAIAARLGRSTRPCFCPVCPSSSRPTTDSATAAVHGAAAAAPPDDHDAIGVR